MITIEVKGLQELERQLLAMGDKAVKVMRNAGREALAPVLEDMKAHAGFDDASAGEHMRDTIKIRSTSRMNDDKYLTVITLRVGPSKKHHMKALAQEFGTINRWQRRLSVLPWITTNPAFFAFSPSSYAPVLNKTNSTRYTN